MQYAYRPTSYLFTTHSTFSARQQHSDAIAYAIGETRPMSYCSVLGEWRTHREDALPAPAAPAAPADYCVEHPVCDACGQGDLLSDALCSNCDNCLRCCECKECSACGTLNDETSRCSNCDACDSCCECYTCASCDEKSADPTCSNCDACDSCCSCWHCGGCGRTRGEDEFRCEGCECCERCCECYTCDSCGDRVTDYCGECERCNDCCNCGERHVELTDGDFQFHTAAKNQHKRIASKRYISLELEVSRSDSGHRTDDACAAWGNAVVTDGSLPDSGFEINTNPSSGDLFAEHITEVCSALNRDGAEVDSCCGMHCHVSASDYSYFDLFKLCALYSHLEDGMFDLCSRSRRNGSYSRSCARSYGSFDRYETFKHDIITALYGSDALEVRKMWDGKTSRRVSVNRTSGKRKLASMCEKYGQARYSALNLHSFFYRGTVEFRHHQGSVNAGKAINWGILCASILDAAVKMSHADILALRSLSSFDALLAVIPADLREWAQERKAALKSGRS